MDNIKGSNVPLYTSEDNAKLFAIKSWRMTEIVIRTDRIDLSLFVKSIEDWDSIDEYYVAVHDKDFKDDGTPVTEHVHAFLKFKNPTHTAAILNYFNKHQDFDGTLDHTCFEFPNLSKIKNGWASAIAYGSHLNAPDKYQYHADPDFRCWTNIEDVGSLSSSAVAPIKNKRLRELVSYIESGKLTRENRFLHPELYTVQDHVRFEKQLDSIFEYFHMRDVFSKRADNDKCE